MKSPHRQPTASVEVMHEAGERYSITLLTPIGRGATAGMHAVCKFMESSEFAPVWTEAKRIGWKWGAEVHFNQT